MKHNLPLCRGVGSTTVKPAHPLYGLVARFAPKLGVARRSLRSSALLITLIIMTLITILVIAFLGLASQDLKSTYFYVRTDQADQIARGGLDFVVGNLQGEIQDANLSATNFGTAQSPFYVPLGWTNAFPARMVALTYATTNILLCSSNTVFYTNGLAPSTMASAIPSTNSSLNNQVITVSDWNKPMLVPYAQTANMPIPNWVFVGRNGPVSVTSGMTSKTVSPNLTNSTSVIGRYAFVVYDTSGLLDINVAGYDPLSNMTNYAAGKGLLPYADLTQLLPGIITTNDVSALVQFRNAVSETNFPLALTNSNGYGLESNGFMQVYAPSSSGSSDTAFLSRQEFIKYANNNPDWTNALPYLTTFSRELNGPIWGPTANMGNNGTNYNYQTLANSASTATATNTINPNTFAVRVPASWVGNSTNPTRNNGLAWIAGDPLVKYRFPLDKLALLQKMQGVSTLSSSDITNIAAYFGLDPVSDSNGYYRHWQYPTTNSKYLHTNGQILTLAQVAALTTPREPDFFELLQAGILNGSLGAYGRSASGTVVDMDPKSTIQTLRIGANIMNQWNSDNYPVTISFIVDSSGDTYNVYGTADLPYITQMFTKAYSTGSSNLTMPIYPYIYFQIWNPHQTPPTSVYNSANYPSQFRIVPYYNTNDVSDSDSYWFKLIYNTGGTNYRWAYNSSSSTWGTSSPYYFNSLSPTYGGGSESANASGQGLNFTFNAQTNYREPGLVVGTPNPTNNGTTTPAAWVPATNLGGGSPPGQLAAISMPAITAYPTNGTPCTQPTTGATNWLTSAMSQTYTVNYVTQTVWVLQYQDQSAAWRTYSTFIGLDTQAPIAGTTGWNVSGFEEPTTNAGTGDVSWVRPDPRTFRLGISEENQVAVSTLPHGTGIMVTNAFYNATNPPLLTPTSVAWYINSTPSITANTVAEASSPFRMDYWVANTTNNPAIPLSSNPYMTDPDGAVRGGDSAFAYSTGGAWGSNPELPGGSGSSYQSAALPARPVMLNHPFNSVGDLGYAYRDDPWRTLDFMNPDSADAGLLDLFNLSEAPVVAGRVNPNTPYANVIATLVNGATQSSVTSISGATATVPSVRAQGIGTSFVSLTSSTPITNRASIVTSGAVSNIIGSGYFSDSVKTESESLVRSLAESSNTRTWNFLIDVIGQSGHFVNNSALVSSNGKDNFVVDGERHYWLHVAIDRYTGKVVDEQLEIVDQ